MEMMGPRMLMSCMHLGCLETAAGSSARTVSSRDPNAAPESSVGLSLPPKRRLQMLAGDGTPPTTKTTTATDTACTHAPPSRTRESLGTHICWIGLSLNPSKISSHHSRRPGHRQDCTISLLYSEHGGLAVYYCDTIRFDHCISLDLIGGSAAMHFSTRFDWAHGDTLKSIHGMSQPSQSTQPGCLRCSLPVRPRLVSRKPNCTALSIHHHAGNTNHHHYHNDEIRRSYTSDGSHRVIAWPSALGMLGGKSMLTQRGKGAHVWELVQ